MGEKECEGKVKIIAIVTLICHFMKEMKRKTLFKNITEICSHAKKCFSHQ